MAVLVAFGSLPFGLRGGVYHVQTSAGKIEAHVSAPRFNPFLSVTSRPELAQMIPEQGEGDGFTTYTWYDHPFVLRVVFGRNVASLGSINSTVTVVKQLPNSVNPSHPLRLIDARDGFSDLALEVMNRLIVVVRHKAHLFQISDLERDDIDITVRSNMGEIIQTDPLQDQLIEAEQAEHDTLDLTQKDDIWYRELEHSLAQEEPLSLADMLLVEAERALTQRFFRQVITTCHTAIEASVSSLLTRGMEKQRMSPEQIDHTLSTRSLTSKLEALLRRYTGSSLKRDNRSLWHQFGELNDLRNDTVHRGMNPSVEDAHFATGVTRDILRWLSILQRRIR